MDPGDTKRSTGRFALGKYGKTVLIGTLIDGAQESWSLKHTSLTDAFQHEAATSICLSPLKE